MSFTPSEYQQAVFDFVQEGEGNAVIEAVAGSGKTTTIVRALRYTEGKVLFSAFNKSIVRELKGRVPSHVQVSTLHSLGYSLIRWNLKGIKCTVDNDKRREITKTILDREFSYVEASLIGLVNKLVNFTQSCLLTGTVEDLDWICDHYGLFVNGTPLESLSRWVQSIIAESTRQATEQGRIDFNDMIYLPAKFLKSGKWRCWYYEWVFVDEAQDLSSAQRIIIEKLLGRRGRCVAVGDSCQAIYGFRGADVQSMKLLKEHLNAIELPLSICYRCPTSHVEMAKSIVPHIEAFEGAKEGEIKDVYTDEMVEMAESGDLVMCRCNAPLIRYALTLISAGKKAVVRGRDLSKGLVNLIKKMKTRKVDTLLEKLYTYSSREIKRLRAAEKETQAQSLEDKVACVQALAAGIEDVSTLIERVQSIFSDDVEGIVLSSVHRAKGLEANRTFILDFARMPLRWRTQRDWQYTQELNIKYVALTRSKSEMYIVSEEDATL